MALNRKLLADRTAKIERVLRQAGPDGLTCPEIADRSGIAYTSVLDVMRFYFTSRTIPNPFTRISDRGHRPAHYGLNPAPVSIGAIVLSDDGAYPGIVYDQDSNGWWVVCWLKWGPDSPDRLISYLNAEAVAANRISADECARRFRGYVPDILELGLEK